MFPADALKEYLGWCPREHPWKENAARSPGWSSTDGNGGWDPTTRGRFGGWNVYHNQVLVMAVLVSVAAAALFLIFGKASGYRVFASGIAIGLGTSIGFLISYRRKYELIAEGEFRKAKGSRKERIIQYWKNLRFSVPATLVILAACVVLLGLLGLIGPILGLMVGMSLCCWDILCVTIFWERRRRMTLISEKGSIFAVNTGNPHEAEVFACQ